MACTAHRLKCLSGKLSHNFEDDRQKREDDRPAHLCLLRFFLILILILLLLLVLHGISGAAGTTEQRCFRTLPLEVF